MRTLIYKRTHPRDPGPEGQFDIHALSRALSAGYAEHESRSCIPLRGRPGFRGAETVRSIRIIVLQEDWSAAVNCFREAIEIDPSYVEAHYDLARTLRQADRHVEALTAFDSLIALVPQFAEAPRERGLVLTLR